MLTITGMKTWLRNGAAGIGLGVLTVGAYLGFLQLSGNFHTVIDGELYRSAQPTAGQIEDYARRYGIQTIVNLRGASDDASWYADEVATAKRLGINHMDFRMLASKQLTAQEADALVAMLKDAPKPILIHCRGGADRTGLASVLYSQRIAGIPTHKAEQQLSLYFGHVGVPMLSSAYAMDLTWEMLERHYGLEQARGDMKPSQAAVEG
jgi:protein tyrosine/serine phosphatase